MFPHKDKLYLLVYSVFRATDHQYLEPQNSPRLRLIKKTQIDRTHSLRKNQIKKRWQNQRVESRQEGPVLLRLRRSEEVLLSPVQERNGQIRMQFQGTLNESLILKAFMRWISRLLKLRKVYYGFRH